MTISQQQTIQPSCLAAGNKPPSAGVIALDQSVSIFFCTKSVQVGDRRTARRTAHVRIGATQYLYLDRGDVTQNEGGRVQGGCAGKKGTLRDILISFT